MHDGPKRGSQVIELPAPEPVHGQLTRLAGQLQRALGANFIGIYLHGSLAMGCFNPGSSDIDLLVRVRHELAPVERDRVISLLLDLSGEPAPFEISILSDADLDPWRHPTPFTLHFSEDWRGRFAAGSADDMPIESRLDSDLAAHITLLHARGVVLAGSEIDAVFPPVPEPDYLDSILGDRDWALKRLAENPVYAVLNLARVLQFQTECRISSKREAGEWIVDRLPDDLKPVAGQALEVYDGSRDVLSINQETLRRYIEEIVERGSTA